MRIAPSGLVSGIALPETSVAPTPSQALAAAKN